MEPDNSYYHLWKNCIHIWVLLFKKNGCTQESIEKKVPWQGLEMSNLHLSVLLEMGPDLTRAYFWPAVNKRPTPLWPGYFSTQTEEIFFEPNGKKLKNLTFLGEIFQIQTQTINGWPNPSHKKLTWPNLGQKILTQTHHYVLPLIGTEKVETGNPINRLEFA